MKRTTILLDEDSILALELLADQRGVSKTKILREALADYAARMAPVKAGLPSFTGCGASSYRGSLGKDAEKLIRRRTRRKGWR